MISPGRRQLRSHSRPGPQRARHGQPFSLGSRGLRGPRAGPVRPRGAALLPPVGELACVCVVPERGPSVRVVRVMTCSRRWVPIQASETLFSPSAGALRSTRLPHGGSRRWPRGLWRMQWPESSSKTRGSSRKRSARRCRSYGRGCSGRSRRRPSGSSSRKTGLSGAAPPLPSDPLPRASQGHGRRGRSHTLPVAWPTILNYPLGKGVGEAGVFDCADPCAAGPFLWPPGRAS